MRKAQFFAILLLGILISGILPALPSGQHSQAGAVPSQKPATPASSATRPSKVVIKVGDKQATVADMEALMRGLSPQDRQVIATQGTRPVAEQYALVLLLSQQAARDHLDSTPEFVKQAEFQKQQLLAQAEYQKLITEAKVSPEEISKYFSDHKTELQKLQVRRVVVRKAPAKATPGAAGLEANEARARADSIREALVKGTDPKSPSLTEGLKNPSDVVIDSQPQALMLGQLPPDLQKPASSLKEGEWSSALETPEAFVCFQLVKRQDADLKELSSGIENGIRQQKVQAEVETLKSKSAIWLDEAYFKAGPQSSATTAPATSQAANPAVQPK